MGKKSDILSRRNLLLNHVHAAMWHIQGDTISFSSELSKEKKLVSHKTTLSEFRNHVAPESHEAYDMLCNYSKHIGPQRIRIRMRYNKDFHWYELAYNTTKEDARKHDITGLLYNIDDIIKNEHQLIEAQKLNSEIKAKESFIANIGDDLNVPFETIIGFSQLLASDKGEMKQEEKMQLTSVIHENTKQLLNIINKVVHNSLTK